MKHNVDVGQLQQSKIDEYIKIDHDRNDFIPQLAAK